MDPVPDPILSEKFLGYSRESNPGPLGWQSEVLTTIPNRWPKIQLTEQGLKFGICRWARESPAMNYIYSGRRLRQATLPSKGQTRKTQYSVTLHSVFRSETEFTGVLGSNPESTSFILPLAEYYSMGGFHSLFTSRVTLTHLIGLSHNWVDLKSQPLCVTSLLWQICFPTAYFDGMKQITSHTLKGLYCRLVYCSRP